jgi:hypothetical protein
LDQLPALARRGLDCQYRPAATAPDSRGTSPRWGAAAVLHRAPRVDGYLRHQRRGRPGPLGYLLGRHTRATGTPNGRAAPQDALVRLPMPRGGNRPPSRRIRHLPAPVATFNGSIRAFAPPRVAATWHRGRLRRLPPSRRSPPPRFRSRRTSPGRGRSGGGPRPSTCLRRDRSSCTRRSSGPAGTGDERQPAAPGKWGQRGATPSARSFMRPEATQRPGRNRRAPA